MRSAIIDFLNTGDNFNNIIVGIIVGTFVILLTLLITKFFWNPLEKSFNWLMNSIWKIIILFFQTIRKKSIKNFKTAKTKRKYKKTIKLIEKKEIEIPQYFLLNKSAEKNPELKKIFEMIEAKEIEAPASFYTSKFLKENPQLFENLAKEMANKPPQLPNIKLADVSVHRIDHFKNSKK